ncbi:MAG: hypothetical protein ACKV2Q_18115, partial [Planctomycetaceae bacterium]
PALRYAESFAVSPLESTWKRRRLRPPREEGEVRAIPPLAEMPALIARNREQIAKWDVLVLGRSLTDLRRLARKETLAAAGRFTNQPEAELISQSRDRQGALTEKDLGPLIVGGHQPDLFHPGVWAKNFVLDDLARTTGGVGLHLIVDNDAITSTSIAVPVGSREQPRIEHIPFDLNAGPVPWEEARLGDESLFRTFADRVSAALSCWPIEPMLSSLWPVAVARLPARQSEPRPRLVDLLTSVRREAERRAGLSHLELPISQLCETESFAWFVGSLLSDSLRTHTIYNEVVAEYRRINRVRHRQQPVPDLTIRANGDWLEFPFWIWRADDTRRERLFVRATSTELQLAIGDNVIATLSHTAASAPESLVTQLRELSSRGWKLRPRALTTTLFVRVFLADAFLHGIGGAKYDEMTDRLIARLFGVAPPSYLTVTATHRLPLGGWAVTSSDVAALKHRLWDFDHNPERYPRNPVREPGGVRPRTSDELGQVRGLTPSGSPSVWATVVSPADSEFVSLLTEKQRLIAEQQAQDALDRPAPRRTSRAENNQRRHRLRTISQRLATLAGDTRSALITELQAGQRHLAANAVLCSREFSFCLFASIQHNIWKSWSPTNERRRRGLH